VDGRDKPGHDEMDFGEASQEGAHHRCRRSSPDLITLQARARRKIVYAGGRNESSGSVVGMERIVTTEPAFRGSRQREESDMTTETQIHTIARQMYEKHGPEAIAHAARNALASERRGDNEDAREWRQVEDAMKMMRGPHQS
jgi:hypothetical protein